MDLFIVVFLSKFFFQGLDLNFTTFEIYLAISWSVLSVFTRFYEVYRFTMPVEIISKIAKQCILFYLLIIAFFPFYKKAIFSGKATALYLSVVFIFVIVLKTIAFYYFKKYRLVTGNNFRNVVIIGYTLEAIDLRTVFQNRADYGYRFKGYFSDKKTGAEIIGKTELLKEFVIAEKIDEIYCSINELSSEKHKELVEFADDNNIVIKFIPDSKVIFSKNMKIDYYELFPVLSLQKSPLDSIYVEYFKRLFDLFFSLLVIVFLLSWLTPLLGLLIKIESKGPIFFKQSRPGLNEEEFICYKFRSMQINQTTEIEASRNDPRVTRIGKFIRKTSIDELPQFFNVLVGDMSVVGPRPHLWAQNKTYGRKIKKYMIRHHVKPGVTGLAQVKGFRGEIETEDDMVNRIKFDVFYIENWSMWMDIKIIIQTIVNIFKGEEKAY
ncbi:undecaprenyl-phosphate glucose phosphotransferase [Flavobacterium sp. 20NA77.7]|uniref:Undecaprenyl-phosphate glucose phosphotransferase n=1 Tax=Flavobacterium nakdongensis TaxID=3073563 RepID=A0ABY9R9I2_9FLAO|nr:undecaprenyl-phosphate glucose phosphotransferase [Flavobacterium sp. 20NA77.7]WMW77888.1 undecaprenyl-phosphate glucose phosphotransferase [Flavobacterium sp. 20NA77.7]